MPRGGRRSKAPGSPAKPNRTDLNNPAAQAAAVTRPPRVRPGFGGTQGLQATPPAARQETPIPGAGGAFARPTERPNEPITDGLPMGAGRGPEALPPAPGGGALDEIRILFMRFPYPELRELIEEMQEEAARGLG